MAAIPPSVPANRAAHAPIVASVGKIAQLARENVTTVGTGDRLGTQQRLDFAMRYADMVNEFSGISAAIDGASAGKRLLLPLGPINQVLHAEKQLHNTFLHVGRYESSSNKPEQRLLIRTATRDFAEKLTNAHTRLDRALSLIDAPARPRASFKTPAWALGGRRVPGTGSDSASSAGSSSSSSSGSSPYAYVDGQVIDGLTGLPPRGYSRSAGPDDAYDPQFSGRSSGSSSFSGPDGTYDAGVFLG
jgi:hypothetical protein